MLSGDDSFLTLQSDYFATLKANLEDHRHIRLDFTNEEFNKMKELVD
jgi:hypothetical protein